MLSGFWYRCREEHERVSYHGLAQRCQIKKPSSTSLYYRRTQNISNTWFTNTVYKQKQKYCNKTFSVETRKRGREGGERPLRACCGEANDDVREREVRGKAGNEVFVWWVPAMSLTITLKAPATDLYNTPLPLKRRLVTGIWGNENGWLKEK